MLFCNWSVWLGLKGCNPESQIRPYLRHVYWTCVHRVYSWTLGWTTSLQWGSTLTIETFSGINSTFVMLNIWAEQNVCTSLNKKRCKSLEFAQIKKCQKRMWPYFEGGQLPSRIYLLLIFLNSCLDYRLQVNLSTVYQHMNLHRCGVRGGTWLVDRTEARQAIVSVQL